MFAWISVFVVVTFIAGLAGLTGGVHVATNVAEVLFLVLLLLSVIALMNALLKRRSSLHDVERHAKNKA